MNDLSLEILDFIEELSEKYGLDKNIEIDSLTRDRILKASSPGERQFIKLIFLKNPFPSLQLIDIVKNFTKKEKSSFDLKKEIEKKLELNEEITNQIYQEILNNSLINDFIKSNTIFKKTSIKKGLSQELE